MDVLCFHYTFSICLSILDGDLVFEGVATAVEDVPELDLLVLDASDLKGDLHEVRSNIEAVVDDALVYENLRFIPYYPNIDEMKNVMVTVDAVSIHYRYSRPTYQLMTLF